MFLSFDFFPGCFACSCTLGVSFSFLFFFGGREREGGVSSFVNFYNFLTCTSQPSGL